jgi:hypothetical protein
MPESLGRVDSSVFGGPHVFREIAMTASNSILNQLMAVIEQRFRDRPEKSYTTRLFEGGVPKIGQKVLEEAAGSPRDTPVGGRKRVVAPVRHFRIG